VFWAVAVTPVPIHCVQAIRDTPFAEVFDGDAVFHNYTGEEVIESVVELDRRAQC
jgi:hypothetical protein